MQDVPCQWSGLVEDHWEECEDRGGSLILFILALEKHLCYPEGMVTTVRIRHSGLLALSFRFLHRFHGNDFSVDGMFF